MKNIKLLFIVLMIGLLAGCLEDAGQTSEIIIPPGAMIKLDLSEVRKTSKDRYSLFLAEKKNDSGAVNNLVDLNALEKQTLFETILPKGVSPSGAMVVKVIMEYSTVTWYGIAFAEEVVKPTLESTLVFNLLSSYPGRKLTSYTSSEIAKLTKAVESFKEERMRMFGLPSDYNQDYLYAFLRNGLSNDHQFLTYLKNEFQVSFDFDSNGQVLSDPFPFGRDNRPPLLDEKATTRLVEQRVRENQDLIMRATVRDPDGDQLFYAWMLEGQIMPSAEEGKFSWTPDFENGRLAPYQISVLITDGGKIIRVDWPVIVEDVNRRPMTFADCGKVATENQEWTCVVNYTDDDGDPLIASVESVKDSNPVFIQGNPSPAQVSGRKDVTLRWTPNNEDARKRSATIVLKVEDGRGGMTFLSFPLTVIDVNSNPQVIGIVPDDPSYIPGEWDTCADEDPLGRAPYKFHVDIVDPDNIAGVPANPPDTVDVTIGGTLMGQLKELERIATAEKTRVTYEWKPMRSSLKGTITVSAKDNHGGLTPAKTFEMEAEARNTVPCLLTEKIEATLNKTSQVTTLKSVEAVSNSGSPVWIEYFNFNTSNLDFLKLTRDEDTGFPFVLKETVGTSGPVYRVLSSKFNSRFSSHTKYMANKTAGYVVFSRSSPHSADVTIPKGFRIDSNAGTSGYTVGFETALDVKLEPGDLKAYIPVVAINREAPANSLVVMGSALADATIQVKNTSAISEQGLVTFYRPGISATDIVIPRGFVVKTNGNPSIEFYVPKDFKFPAASSSYSVPVWRKTLVIPTGDSMSIVSSQPGGPTLAVTAGVELSDWNLGGLWPDDKATIQEIVRTLKYRAMDGSVSPAGSIKYFASTLPAGASNLTVDNPQELSQSVFTHEGRVRFSRPTATTSFTLPAGFLIRDSLYAIFEVISPVSFAIGESTKDVWVRRTRHIGRYGAGTLTPPLAAEGTASFKYVDTGTTVRVISNNMITATEGVDLLDGLVEVSDSGNSIPSPYEKVDPYWYPKDPHDYFSMGISPNGTAPKGEYKLCREVGSSFGDTCTTCTEAAPPLAYRDYYSSARCYLRYRPHAEDLSGTFSFKISGYEFPAWSGGSSSSVYSNSITLVVKEINRAPVLTQSNYTPYGGGVGSTFDNPIEIGAFSEGTAGYFDVYFTDANRGTELKTLALALDGQIYDRKTGTWKARPSTMSVSVLSRTFDTSGAGSQTKGRVYWTPTDAQTKLYSGADGIVIKVRAYDAATSPTVSTSTYAYYRIRVYNRNQYPTIASLATNNYLTIQSDTYYYKDFYVYDNDGSTPEGRSFTTSLTLCKGLSGNPLLHPTLDTPNADPVNCHAQGQTWSADISTYDPSYTRNLGVANCALAGALKSDLAVPKLYQRSAATTVSGRRQQLYRLEWCPQRTQLGEHSATLFASDNGDEDRDGVSESKTVGSAPLKIKLVAPVFLKSPRLDLSKNPEHFMPQTVAGMSSYPFTYPVIISNSKGNAIEYTLTKSPRACAETNGMCISSSGVITWVPKNPDDITPEGGNGHLVEVQVRDKTTGETDKVHFYLNVQNPLTMMEQSPVIESYFPEGTPQVAEKASVQFQVTASDPNSNDILFYRWYVDNVLVEDEGAQFNYIPKDTDGSYVDPTTGIAGLHKVRVEVTDGNLTVSREWSVKVRNSLLLAENVFDLVAARKESPTIATPTNIQWLNEVPWSVSTTSGYKDHIIFSGQYKIGTQTRNFVWDFLMSNGTVPKPNGTTKAGSKWNFIETLPWPAGTKTERLSVTSTGATSYNVLLTSQLSRSGPFGTTTQALKILNSDWTALNLSTSNACNSDCAGKLYTSKSFSGNRLTASMGDDYTFYASDSGDMLYYDYILPSNNWLVYAFNEGFERITGLAYSSNLDRLYVVTQQENPSMQHRLYIFNTLPAKSGGVPSLISSMSIWNGVPGFEDTRPTDVVVDPVTDKVIILLAGTGELAVLSDSSSLTPQASDLVFHGTGLISKSPFDMPGQGRRLAINVNDRLLFGTMKDASQLFSMDLATNSIAVTAAPDPIDGVYVLDSGQTLLVSRSTAKIYKGR